MSSAIRISPRVSVPAAALEVRAVRSSGPGGQNVNKVATKVELVVSLDEIVGLSEPQKVRLRAAAGARLSTEGRIHITSQLTRSQQANLEDARAKLQALIEGALPAPKRRVPTRPTRAAKERRLSEKRRTATRKTDRRWQGD
jgi:ribosome-associated protein